MEYKLNSKSTKYLTLTLSLGILVYIYFQYDSLTSIETSTIALSSQIPQNKNANKSSILKLCQKCHDDCSKGFSFKNQIEKCMKTVCKNCPKIKIIEKKSSKKVLFFKFFLIFFLIVVVITSIALIIIEASNYKETDSNNAELIDQHNNNDLFTRLNDNSLVEI